MSHTRDSSDRARRTRRSQRGATLIELMIAMLVASILIGMVLSVYTRLSVGYRAQSQVSDLQQSLGAAKLQIVRDIRSAGHMIPNGVNISWSPDPVKPIVVENDILPGNADFSPDMLALYRADTTAMAAVTGHDTPITMITVDSVDNFAIGDLAVIVNQRTVTAPGPGIAPIAEYDACLVEITATTVTPDPLQDDGISIDSTGAPYNTIDNQHCTDALDMTRASPPMIYHFKARWYRIDPDPAQRSLGVLQTSPVVEPEPDDWEDIGLGFTNLQFAVRYYEPSDVVDRDADGDTERDWYSGTPPPGPPVNAVPFAVTVSLEVRSRNVLDLVPTDATPRFIEGAKDPSNNRIGDWDSVQLGGVADATRPEQYRGNHIYRWSTTTVDVRNMGVGR